MMFKHRRIRYKLLVAYSIVFILSISLGSTFVYMFVRRTIKKNIESELTNTTNAILNMVRTSVSVSIKNHLRAVAEKNLELVQYFHSRSLKGDLTRDEAQQQAAELMLSQTIGESGYIYCVRSDGVVSVHPQAAMIGTDVSNFQFVRDQLRLKKGYLEYEWQNPGETRKQPKALYMLYFEPWDWIISVSSYRKEFKNLINVDDLRKGVLDMRLGKTGYAFLVDGQGTAIIHPKLEGVNILEEPHLPNRFLESMQRRRSGEITYAWKNPDEPEERLKFVIFNHIPEYDWIVASSSYLDEFYEPLNTIRNLIIATVLITLALALPITFKISASITDPLQRLMQHFTHGGIGDFTRMVQATSTDEIGQLCEYFNRFMAQLEAYHQELTREIRVRRRVEADLRQSEARYRSVMEAAPDPIVTYDMQGLVTYVNPAFSRVFGWSAEECLGQRLDHYVPEENWEETHQMIALVLSGGKVNGTPTRRYDKAGRIIHVSISGATYRDQDGQLQGSIIILRDITQARHLQTLVMDIADRERQLIGQDMHDDLCPHLIGIEGLGAVLQSHLSESGSPHTPLAQKIVDLIAAAIAKARGYARGLCPVHMVSHGLATALQNLADHTTAVTGATCRFQCNGAVDLKDNTIATHLFYIAQEAVSNAVKHAGAKQIAIVLQRQEERIALRVSDDGGGMPADRPKAGIGLQIMQYRANMIGAGFNLQSSNESGTSVHVVLKQEVPILIGEA
ncbi:MAG: cache domain-containing protein [Desulfatitalea sp.]